MSAPRKRQPLRPAGATLPARRQVEPHVRPAQLRVQWRFLLVSLVLFGATASALAGAHHWQLRRLATALFERAEEQRQQKHWQAAAETYHRYLKLRPDHAEARRRLAECYGRTADSPQRLARAIDLYYQALGSAPDDMQLRQHLGEQLLAQRRFTPAIELAQTILARQPNDAAALRLAALSQCGLRNSSNAPLTTADRDLALRAITANPQDVVLTATIAYELRAVGQRTRNASENQRADQLFDDLVETSPQHAVAWLARHRYRAAFKLAGAHDDVTRARELSPEDSQILFAAGEDALSSGDFSAALALADRLLTSQGQAAAAYRLQGDALLRLQRVDEAILAWQKCVSSDRPLPEIDLRLATALLLRGRHAEADLHLASLERLLQTSDAARLAELRSTTRMLRAQWHLASGDWPRAWPLLREVALAAPTKSLDDAQRHVEAWSLLAQRELAQERYDLAAELLERAVQIQPTNVRLRLALAQSCWQAGQWPVALRQVEFVRQLDPQSREAAILLAQLQLGAQSRLPAADRDLADFDESLAEAGRLAGDSPALVLLAAARPFVQGDDSDRQRAKQSLIEAIDTFAAHPEFLASAAMMLEYLGETNEADRALALAVEAGAPSANLLLRRVEITLRRGNPGEAARHLGRCESQLRERDMHRAAQLWRQIELQRAQPDRIAAHWERLNKQSPSDLYLRMLLAEDALAQKDLRAAATHEARLLAIEGESGSAWRYARARRLMIEASPQANAEVKQLADWLVARRPGWPKTWLLAGVLAESQQDWNGAISAYQQVATLDGTQTLVLERLVKLLYRRGRFSEVDRFLAALSHQGPLSSEASLIAIGSAAAKHDIDQALDAARQAIATDPDHVAAVLWLAHLLQSKGQRDEALQTLIKLVAERSTDARAWGGLLAFHQAAGQRDEFRQALAKFEQADIAPREKHVLLAQAYELLGEPDRAAGEYVSALVDEPEDGALRLRLAAVQLQFDAEAAEVTLRALRRKYPQSMEARRLLAVTLAAHRKHSAWPEIKELLAGTPEATGGDLRLASMLRRGQGDPASAREARRLFAQALAKTDKPAAQDLLLLATLYEQEGDVAGARKQIELVARQSEIEPATLASVADFHLRHDETDAALAIVARLERKLPDDWGVRRLKAVAFQKAGQHEQLDELFASLGKVGAAIEKPEQQAVYAVQLASLFDVVDRTDEAEAQLRRALELHEGGLPTLVHWYIAKQRYDDALAASLQAVDAGKMKSAPAMLAVALRQCGEASAPQRTAAEDWLTKLLQDTQDADLLFAAGDLRLSQHRREEALQLFDRLVVAAPKHYIALNNVAALLADQPGQQALALEYIDRAIAAAPQPLAFLRDTKAKILLHQDRAADALVELEAIIKRWPDGDPRVYLHLALAQDKLGRRAAAQQSLAQARERGLKIQDLTAGDRERLAELDQRLAAVQREARDEARP